MKPKKNDLALDCVEMKRSIQGQLAAETRGMTHEQELEFHRRRVAAGSLALHQRLEVRFVPEPAAK